MMVFSFKTLLPISNHKITITIFISSNIEVAFEFCTLQMTHNEACSDVEMQFNSFSPLELEKLKYSVKKNETHPYTF